MENHSAPALFSLQIDEEGSNHLEEIAKWAKLFSILGLIAGILIILAGLVTAIFGSSISSFGGINGVGAFVGILSLIFSAVYLYPSWLLLKFSNGIPAAIKTGDQVLVNESFKNLKSCFKFWGVVSIVIIALYMVVFILGIVGKIIN